MRITGGKYLNRKVECPRGEIRPAMDQMRESLFSILGNIEGASFLDVFSGSGLVGIEAVSRGAALAVLIEKDGRKIPVIKKNISFVEEDIRVVTMTAERYLSRPSRRFDYIYLDPPFPYKNKTKLLELVSENTLAEDEGVVMLHHPSEDVIADTIGSLVKYRTKKYGRSILDFFSVSSPIQND